MTDIYLAISLFYTQQGWHTSELCVILFVYDNVLQFKVHNNTYSMTMCYTGCITYFIFFILN